MELGDDCSIQKRPTINRIDYIINYRILAA